METLWRDVRYGVLTLLKQPTFSVVAIATLTIAIGANTAIFTVINAVLLRPLPFEKPELLYKLNTVWPNNVQRSTDTSPLNFLDWRKENRGFENLGGYTSSTALNLSGAGEPERISAATVSDSLLPTLGVKPLLGRNFSADEDRKGANNVVLLSYGIWMRKFGGDEKTIGSAVTLDDRPYTVIGVMPNDFAFPSTETSLWIPFADNYENGGRGNFFVQVIGKLKPGVTPAQAQADMSTVAATLEQQYPEANHDSGIVLAPLQELVTRKIRPTLWLLWGAVAFLLLIACSNVANLMLARTATRQREIAVRSALGASRFRIVRQLISESAVLALIGGLFGLFIAYWSVRVLIWISPEEIPRLDEISVDARILVFTFSISALTCLLFGLVPAFHALRINLQEMLKQGERGSAAGGSLIRNTFVVTEFALALILMIGAGLILRSFWRVLSVSPGFEVEQILTFDLSLPYPKYDRDRSSQFFTQTLERLSRLPGVATVGATTSLPFSKTNNIRYFTIEGRPGDRPGDYTLARHRQVSPGYFQTLNIPLLKGRYFTSQDLNGPASTVVINQSFAQVYFHNQDPIGKRLKMGEQLNSAFPWMTVIGVVGDVKHTSLELEATPEMYRPFAHNQDWDRKMTYAVRTTQDPQPLIAAIRREIQILDSNQPIANVNTMEQLIGRSVAKRRFSLILMGIFAMTAMVLATVGVYGVMSYTITQNRREIGIRVALGAQRRDILKLIVGQGLMLSVVGTAIGLAGGLAVTRISTSFLFGVTPTDPTTLVTATAGLIGVVLLACYIPARRASKIDPLEVIRYE